MLVDPRTLQRRQYMASVALSNAAVSLLEHNAYADARDTIKDASDSLDMRNPQTMEEAEQLLGDLNKKLLRASLCLREAKPKEEVSFNLYVISDKTDPTLVKSKLDAAQTTECLFAVRLETLEGGILIDDQAMQIASAVIMHNLATTLHCLALNGDSAGEQSDVLSNEALRLFRLSEQKLSDLLVAVPSAEYYRTRQILLLVLLSLRNLMQVAFDLNRLDEGRYVCSRLFGINERIARLEETPLMQFIDMVAPAA